MSSPNVSTPRSSATTTADVVTLQRIRFENESTPARPNILRRYTQPRLVVAVPEDLTIANLLIDDATAAPTHRVDVIQSPKNLPPELRKKIETWIDGPSQPDGNPTLIIELQDARILWRPGKIWIQTSTQNDLLPALIDFSFYESELRYLERSLLAHESTALADTSFAFHIKSADRAHWPRFEETVKFLTLLRLTYARLEPQLYLPPRTLPPESRRLINRLRTRTDIADRLEAFNDRLEACEELYENAIDRITDHRWYKRGMLAEITIVVLLAIEAVLLAWEFYRR